MTSLPWQRLKYLSAALGVHPCAMHCTIYPLLTAIVTRRTAMPDCLHLTATPTQDTATSTHRHFCSGLGSACGPMLFLSFLAVSSKKVALQPPHLGALRVSMRLCPFREGKLFTSAALEATPLGLGSLLPPWRASGACCTAAGRNV
eukprot:1141976-Pelagomonas_calceolata.AAC.5